MIDIDVASPVPIHDQIKAGLRGLVARGLLKPGDQAPSIRGLAERLRVNPNTVARAFRELAIEGFFSSKRGKGTYVSEEAKKQSRQGLEEARERLAEALRLARRGGLTWEDVDLQVKRLKEEAP